MVGGATNTRLNLHQKGLSMSKAKYAICPLEYVKDNKHHAEFTAGKKYKITSWESNTRFYIRPDGSSTDALCLINDCAYMRSFGGRWRFDDEEINEAPKKRVYDPDAIWKITQEICRG